MKFADMPVHSSLGAALARRGYLEPTPVQELMVAPENLGRDLLVSAQTGSGKTVAFGLALSTELLGEGERLPKAGKPLVLVVAPTRELALQVQRELGWLYSEAGGRVTACVGGMDARREQRALHDGAHVVVGTPGRLCDHLDRRSLDLSELKAVVLDEADEMLDMGFRDELERLLKDAPKERRTLLFSATLPSGITQLAKRYQREALRLAASPPHEAHKDIEYIAHVIAPRERDHALVNTLRMHEVSGALVFCATRAGVGHLQASLAERGFGAVAISGELSQSERIRALQALRDGRARVLVATDVAARGLDLPALDLVVHADLPRDSKILQHRSGRTGRAGRKGTSVLLVPFSQRRYADRMLSQAAVSPRWESVPSIEEIRAKDDERLAAQLGALCQEINEEDLVVARRLLAERTPEQLVGALVRQSRVNLPAPEELVDTKRRPERPRRDEGPRAEHPRRFEAPRMDRPRRDDAPRAEHPRRDDAPRGERPRRDDAPRAEHPRRDDAPRGERPRRDDAPRAEHPRRDDAPRGNRPRDGDGRGRDGVWFRVNVGRRGNADPRWLLPLLCRRGGVTKSDIGTIEIFDTETRVLIRPGAADDFERQARRPDKKDPGIRIQLLDTGPPAAR